SAPLASGLLERWIDRAPLSRWWMLAAGLGIAGSLAVCASTLGARPAAAAPTPLGIGLGLVAGATCATFSWSVHRLLTAGIARPAAMGSVFGAGGALLLPVLLLTGAPLVASAQNLVVAGYMALVPMFLGYVLFGIGLTTVPASTATTVTLTEPAVATVLAVVIVGERLGPAGWAGLCLVGLVLIVLALAPTNLAPAEPTAPGTPVRGTPPSARRHAPSAAPQRGGVGAGRASGSAPAGLLPRGRRESPVRRVPVLRTVDARDASCASLRSTGIRRGPERLAGGIGGGRARRFGLSVWLTRALVLASFLLPVLGVGAYLVVWVLTPWQDGSIPLERLMGGGRGTP